MVSATDLSTWRCGRWVGCDGGSEFFEEIVAGSHGASDSALKRQRAADAAQQVRTRRSEKSFVPAIVNSALQPHMQIAKLITR